MKSGCYITSANISRVYIVTSHKTEFWEIVSIIPIVSFTCPEIADMSSVYLKHRIWVGNTEDKAGLVCWLMYLVHLCG